MKLKNGFYTALGTPLGENGGVVAESLKKHVEQQIAAGASGMLLMGSMGIEAFVTNSEYKEIVRIAAETNNAEFPCSSARWIPPSPRSWKRSR